MSSTLSYSQVERLVRAARDWPGDDDQAQRMREYAMPICLASIGIRPWEWERLTFVHLDVWTKRLNMPEQPLKGPWTKRAIVIPPTHFEVMKSVVPGEAWGQEEVFLVRADIALESNEQDTRNLGYIAKRAGIDQHITWRLLQRTYEAWLGQTINDPAKIDLMMGRKPKNRGRRRSSR